MLRPVRAAVLCEVVVARSSLSVSGRLSTPGKEGRENEDSARGRADDGSREEGRGRLGRIPGGELCRMIGDCGKPRIARRLLDAARGPIGVSWL